MSLLLALLTSLPAFAITNLDGCEYLLNVVPDVDLHLEPNQIALRGRLTFDTSVFGDTVPYVVRDDHLEQEITGVSYSAQFPLSAGDEIFVLDGRGGIEARGFYDEATVASVAQRGPGEMRAFLNQPTLLRKPGGRPAVRRSLVARAFTAHFDRRAVVVQTLTPNILARVRKDLAPWFDLNARRPSRVVTAHGRRFHLRSFEEAHRGEVMISRFEYPAQIGGGVSLTVDVRLANGELIPTREGSTLALFDDAREFIGFVRGNRRLVDSEKLLRRAREALLIQQIDEIDAAPTN